MRELSDVRRASARTIKDVENSPPRPPRMLVTTNPNPDLGLDLNALPHDFVATLKQSIAGKEGRKVEETAAIRVASDEELYSSKVVPASATRNVIETHHDVDLPNPQIDPTSVDPSPIAKAAPPQPISYEPSERRSLSDSADGTDASPSRLDLHSSTAPHQIQEADAPAVRTSSNPVDQAIRDIEHRLRSGGGSDHSARIKQEMELRLLRLVAGRFNEALEPIEGMSEHEQAFLQCQLKTLHHAVAFDTSQTDSRRWLQALKDHREAEYHLAAVSSLDVRELAFCSEVLGFGNYKRLPTYRFRPDQELLIYCELDNVVSKSMHDGYQTTLKGSYEILDKDGVRIIEQTLPTESEITKNVRRDMFIVYRIYMPSQIAPGKYQLRLTMEDGIARKFGSGLVEFQIIK